MRKAPELAPFLLNQVLRQSDEVMKRRKMIVVVDQPRHGGMSAQIDRAHAAPLTESPVVADRGELAVPDRHRDTIELRASSV